MEIAEIIKAIGLIGIGGLLKSLLDYLIGVKKQKAETQHDFKQPRYKAIILQCYIFIFYDKERDRLQLSRPDLKTKEDLYDEIYVEWVNMTLYASDKVVFAMKCFVQKPNQKTFNSLILSMRKDLYGIRTKIRTDDLLLKSTKDKDGYNIT
ncbi:hypothetical protein [Tunicatimonas pelagia]|uniref:hypothetical protein n=1 Tax=Tunicatimonas pelagia TaxID=931531 RepID=UPI002666905D|nr:hypothetical protein [Tunicatimonas pelagia]WKN42097.1 hypothetical protein P0M28_23965 [Tunicatimonas pelagia]